MRKDGGEGAGRERIALAAFQFFVPETALRVGEQSCVET